MTVLRLKLSQEELLALPSSLRTTLLGFLFVMDEVHILLKCMMWSMWDKGDPDDRMRAQIVVHSFFQRQLTGKLWEAGQFLQKTFDGKARDLMSEYAPDGLAALKMFRKTLQQHSYIGDIRNGVWFHFDANLLASEIEKAGEPAFVYADSGGTMVNNLYYFVQALGHHALMRMVPNSIVAGEDPAADPVRSQVARSEAYDAVILRAAGTFLQIGNKFFKAVAASRGASLFEGQPVPADVGSLVSLTERRIPWFTEGNLGVRPQEKGGSHEQ